MENLNIEAFNPTKAELARLVETSRKLELPDPFDVEQLVKIGDARKDLKKTRVTIEKTGKVMRDDANKFAKAVIAKEKELIGIIEPEELRLAGLEADAEVAKIHRERTELLPERVRRIEAIKDGLPVPADEELLELDGPAFEVYYNTRVYDRNQAEDRRLQKDRDDIEEGKRKLEHDRQIEEARKQGEKDARERQEREEKEKGERAQREAAERMELRRGILFDLGFTWNGPEGMFSNGDFGVSKGAVETEPEDGFAFIVKNARKYIFDRDEAARKKAELEADERYHNLLRDAGWTEATAHLYRIERNGAYVELYKHVATLVLE